jgi:phosphonate transport system ATP-binding protein
MRFPALEHISISIEEGESVALLGPSGAGKTTLLALLDSQLLGWRGHVSVCGLSLSPVHGPPRERRADTGFIFQEFALVERATVLRNVLNGRLGRMPLLRALFGRVADSDLDVAQAALADCGIADLAERRADTLSGGQRQRIAIARCLAQEPRLILADEPVSNLDPARAVEILTLLTGVGRARGATTIFSSHQPELAKRFAERVIGLQGGRVVFDRPSAALTGDATADLYRDTYAAGAKRLQVVG